MTRAAPWVIFHHMTKVSKRAKPRAVQIRFSEADVATIDACVRREQKIHGIPVTRSSYVERAVRMYPEMRRITDRLEHLATSDDAAARELARGVLRDGAKAA